MPPVPGALAAAEKPIAPAPGALVVTLAGDVAEPMTALATPVRADGEQAYDVMIAEGKHECGKPLMYVGGKQVLWFTLRLTHTIMDKSGKRAWLLRARGFDGVSDGSEGMQDLKPFILADLKVGGGIITAALPAFKLTGESTGKELAVSGVLKASVCPAEEQKHKPVATESAIAVKLAGQDVQMKGVYYVPGHKKDEFSVHLTQHAMACENLPLDTGDDDLAFTFRFKAGAIDRVWMGGVTVPAQYNPETNAKTASYAVATKKLTVAGSLDLGEDISVELSGTGTAHECPAL